MKDSSSSRLLAVDPSLSCSGWVIMEVASGKLLAAGVLVPPGTELALAERLAILQQKIEKLFGVYKLAGNDFLVCEGPAPLVKNPDSATKVEQVRSMFEAIARVFGATVPGRVNPRTVQTELLGMRGRQLARKEVKMWARQTAFQLFGESLCRASQLEWAKIPQDVIDAALIGSYANSLLRQASSASMAFSEAFRPGQKKSWGYSRSKRGSCSWSVAELKKNSINVK